MTKEQWIVNAAVKQIGGVRKLARHTKISPGTISRCARGIQVPNPNTQIRCGRLLGLDGDTVIFGTLAECKAAAGLEGDGVE